MPKIPTCALVVGHTAESPGAVNTSRLITEYEFNNSLAKMIKCRVDPLYCDLTIVHRRRPNDYRGLPGLVNATRADFAVEMHCNAANKRASGSEVLYWHSSEAGRRLAGILLLHFIRALDLPNRGAKPIGSDDRGGYLLRKTRMPCAIAEPFFIDNPEDLLAAETRRAPLAEAYANAIMQYARELVKGQRGT